MWTRQVFYTKRPDGQPGCMVTALIHEQRIVDSERDAMELKAELEADADILLDYLEHMKGRKVVVQRTEEF